MSSGGLACTTSPVNGVASGSTYLNPSDTIDADGTLTHWCFRAGGSNGNDTVKLKVFRINGSNYDYIGESPGITPASSGIKEGSCNINVLAGDLIGVSLVNNASPGGFPITDDGGATLMKYIGGDITTNTAQSSWSNYANGRLIVHSDSTGMIDIYVDINKADDTGTGLTWVTAKKTMNAAYALLGSTGTMHVATGDYSAQTTITYNKSWSLSPEDPNSVGNKTVSIPKSA